MNTREDRERSDMRKLLIIHRNRNRRGNIVDGGGTGSGEVEVEVGSYSSLTLPDENRLKAIEDAVASRRFAMSNTGLRREKWRGERECVYVCP